MRDFVEEMTTFAVVAQTGSFTAAAEKLKRSKAYVSLQVSRLEEAVGLQLLFRTTRRIELTEAGRVYVNFCSQLLETADEANQAVEVLKGAMSGTIRLSVPVSFGQVFLTDIFAKFQERYPDVRFDLELHNALRDLKAESFDMAIRMSRDLEDDLVTVKIGDLIEPVYGAPSYLSSKGRPGSPSELTGYNCILNSHVDKDSTWPFLEDGHIVQRAVTWKMAVNHYPLIKDAAVAGKGLARLPSYLASKDVTQGRLETVLTEYLAPAQPIYLVYAYQGALPLKNRKFIDFVKGWFSDQ